MVKLKVNTRSASAGRRLVPPCAEENPQRRVRKIEGRLPAGQRRTTVVLVQRQTVHCGHHAKQIDLLANLEPRRVLTDDGFRRSAAFVARKGRRIGQVGSGSLRRRGMVGRRLSTAAVRGCLAGRHLRSSLPQRATTLLKCSTMAHRRNTDRQNGRSQEYVQARAWRKESHDLRTICAPPGFVPESKKAGPRPTRREAPHMTTLYNRQSGNYLVSCGSLAVNFDGSFSKAAGQPSQQK